MNIALILSGGTGTRLGSDIPKQYIEVNGQLLISYCLRTFIQHKEVDYVQIVCNSEWIQVIKEDLMKQGLSVNKLMGFSSPGATRQLSILNGLKDIKANITNLTDKSNEDPTIIIHDAARPNLTTDNISEYLLKLEGHDGLMPALPMKDTVYVSEDGKSISALLDRSTIFAGQAPELYKLDKYLEACENLLPDAILKINGSTEPAILAGLNVTIVPGNENNYKITTANDLDKFKAEI